MFNYSDKIAGLSMKIYLKEVKERYPEYEILNFSEDIFFENVNHDSRVNLPNSLFLPIIGEKFNGHDFIQSAFNNGCSVSLMQRDHYESNTFSKPVILVEDLTEGIINIVKLIRGKIHVPVIAVTGSTGKTTTREILSTVLTSKGKVLSSNRNFNTLWGNAQVLCMYDNQSFVVLEFGMDRKGEIAQQCTAISPDLGILLNVGYVHAMQLGNIENVYYAKRELADYLVSTGKPVFFNIDDEWLSRLNDIKYDRKISFGITKSADYLAKDISVSKDGTRFNVVKDSESIEVLLNIYGEGYVYNALAAIAVCEYLGIGLKETVNALKNYSGFKGRFEIVKKSKTLTLINDAYNANPSSMKMSLDAFREIWGEDTHIQKILVLGDMKELGSVTEQKHTELAEYVSKMSVDRIYYIGEYFEYFNIGEHITDLDTLYIQLKEDLKEEKETVILFKASNSINLQEVIDRF